MNGRKTFRQVGGTLALTPALSPGERENCFPPYRKTGGWICRTVIRKTRGARMNPVGTRSTASQIILRKNGTRWNASLPVAKEGWEEGRASNRFARRCATLKT